MVICFVGSTLFGVCDMMREYVYIVIVDFNIKTIDVIDFPFK